LVRILERKLAVVRRMYQPMGRSAFELNALITLGSLYGIELQMDNVLECRQRLFDIFRQTYAELFPDLSQSDEFLRSAQYMLERNILWGDALTLRTPDGSAAIVFSEWSAINKFIKRRDYTFYTLVSPTPMDGYSTVSDLGKQAFIPNPFAEYPLTHYTKIYTHGTPELQS
jgi:hypothetical protein